MQLDIQVWYSVSLELLITITKLGEGEVIERSSHETVYHVIMYLNLELELALLALQKCLVLLHDNLGPNIKQKLWLYEARLGCFSSLYKSDVGQYSYRLALLPAIKSRENNNQK